MRTALGRWDDLPRGRHRPDEPPHGLMMRLATRHRNPSAARFAEAFGIEITDVAACMDVLATYEHADQYPEQIASLRRWVPEAFSHDELPGTWRRIGGQEVRSTDWSVATRRFCPACLAEAAYHRAWFDFTFMRTCPDHGLPIVDRTGDGVSVGFATATLDVTASGIRLALPAPRRGGRPRSFEAYVMGRLGLRDPIGHPVLDGMRLGEVVFTCETVGDAVLGGHRAHRPTAGDLAEDAGEVIEVGFRTVEAGRDAILSAFKAVGREAPVGTYGGKRLFGWVYGAFAPLKATHVVRDLMMDAAHELGRAGTRHSVRREGIAENVTLTRLAETHGLNRQSVRVVADALGVLKGGEAWGIPLLVSERDVRAVVVGFQWALKRDRAAEVLGVTPDTMDGLIRAGHVAPTWRGLNGDNADRFHFGDLLGFVEELPFEFVTEGDPRLSRDPAPVPLPSVLAKSFRLGIDILAEVWAGRVTLLAKTAATSYLSDFLVPQDQQALLDLGLSSLLASWAPRISKAPITAMTKREAATLLAVSPATIAALVAGAHLSMLEGKDDSHRGALDRGSVERFGRRYLAAKFYADAIGRKTQFLTGKAERAGIIDLLRNVRAENARGDIAVIYERTEMTNLLGLSMDPDKALPGYNAWIRFATNLGRGRSRYMVWQVQGEREATCARKNMRWKVRLKVSPKADTGACTVEATLSLSKTDKVDVGSIAGAVAVRRKPEDLNFHVDERAGRLDATVTTVIPIWGADAGLEADPAEDDAFRIMTNLLVDLRTLFDDPSSKAPREEAEID